VAYLGYNKGLDWPLLGGSQVSKARPGAPFDFYRRPSVRKGLVPFGSFRHRQVGERLVSFDFYRRPSVRKGLVPFGFYRGLDREAARAVGIPTNLRECGLDFGQGSL
jgi:hypothetical protein